MIRKGLPVSKLPRALVIKGRILLCAMGHALGCLCVPGWAFYYLHYIILVAYHFKIGLSYGNLCPVIDPLLPAGMQQLRNLCNSNSVKRNT